MVGTHRDDINCSEYLHHLKGVTHSPAPHFDLEEEHIVQQTILRLIQEKVIMSAHDISEGGLFTCLLESAMVNHLGFHMQTDPAIRKDAYLFGEAQSRVVVSVNPHILPMFEAAMHGVPYSKIGTVSAQQDIVVDGMTWGYIADWETAYDTALEKIINS
jgi:phosphoribosylformylglycinamidine synthase